MRRIVFCICIFILLQAKSAYCQLLSPVMMVELFENQLFTVGEKDVYIIDKSADSIFLLSFNIEDQTKTNIKFAVSQDEGELLDVVQYKNNFHFLFQKSIVSFNSLSEDVKTVHINELLVSTKIKVFHKVFANKHGIYLANFFSSGPGDEKIKIIRLDSMFNVLSQYYRGVASCDPFSIYFSEFGLVSITPENGNVLVVTDETNPVIEVLDKGLNKTTEINIKNFISNHLTPKTNLCPLYNEYLRKNTFRVLDKLTAAVDTSAFIEKIIPVGENGFIVSACYFDSGTKFIDYVIRFDEQWLPIIENSKPLDKNFNPALPLGIDNLPFNTFYGAQKPVSSNKYIVTKFISPKILEFAEKQLAESGISHKNAQYHSYILVLGINN